MRILTVSGSLRVSSSNTMLLDAAAAVAPAGICLERYNGLGDLPPFNPDLDNEGCAQSVTQWRCQLQAADAVIFSTPEYAHGVPGVLKNALDWVVGSGELAGKPVTLFNASPRATYARASLKETLTVMSARFVPDSCITLNLLGASLDARQISADPTMSASLRAGLTALAKSYTDTN